MIIMLNDKVATINKIEGDSTRMVGKRKSVSQVPKLIDNKRKHMESLHISYY